MDEVLAGGIYTQRLTFLSVKEQMILNAVINWTILRSRQNGDNANIEVWIILFLALFIIVQSMKLRLLRNVLIDINGLFLLGQRIWSDYLKKLIL